MVLRARIHPTDCREPRIWSRTRASSSGACPGWHARSRRLTFAPLVPAGPTGPGGPCVRNHVRGCPAAAKARQRPGPRLSVLLWRALPPTLPFPKPLPSEEYLLELQPALCHQNYPEGQAESI